MGVNLPLWGRNIGETRPRRDSVRLTSRKPVRLDPAGQHADSKDQLAHSYCSIHAALEHFGISEHG